MTVLVLGSINSDAVVRVPRLPQAGETIRGIHMATYPGGKGANQAVAAARMGQATSLVGRVGRDGVGAYLVEELRTAGLDVDGIGGDMEEPTGVALVTVGPQGENTIVTVGGANHRVGAEELAAFGARLPSASVVVVQLEIPMSAVRGAVASAHAAGVPVVCDPAPVTSIDDDLYAKIDWLTPNEHEAGALTGAADPAKAARILRDRGVGNVVVTMGELGCHHLGPSGATHVPAPRVDAVDSVACGDAFTGCLAASLAAGMEDELALRRACAAGALAATIEGAFPSLPVAAAVAGLIDRV